MGADKASLRIAGERVLGRLACLLSDRIGHVMFVGSEPDWRDMPACVLGSWHPDDVPDRGPLGGVATALRVAGAGTQPAGVCVVGCDMPLLGGALLDHLLAGRDRQAAATAVVNPASGQMEPLLAIYEPHARPSIEKAMVGGELSLTSWLTHAEVTRLPLPEALAEQCTNVNTPAELENVRLRLEARGQ
jgi:molybdopterin-guanine dinucleotide biosynthesis protein A